ATRTRPRRRQRPAAASRRRFGPAARASSGADAGVESAASGGAVTRVPPPDCRRAPIGSRLAARPSWTRWRESYAAPRTPRPASAPHAPERRGRLRGSRVRVRSVRPSPSRRLDSRLRHEARPFRSWWNGTVSTDEDDERMRALATRRRREARAGRDSMAKDVDFDRLSGDGGG